MKIVRKLFKGRRKSKKVKPVRNSGTPVPNAPRITARIQSSDRGVEIEAGAASFFIHALEGDWSPPPVADYAAFALAALSMSNGQRITLEAPVSNSAAQHIERLANIYRLWCVERLTPLSMEFPDQVDDGGIESDAGNENASIICLSGGVDSTYAAIQAMKDGRSWQGLLLAGADYPSAVNPGFVELRQRVGRIADALGMGLAVVESNIRSVGLQYEMMHGINLGASLHFMSAGRAAGAYALDHHLFQELHEHPWGNNSVLPHYLSTEGFPIAGLGGLRRRVEKLAAIHAYDDKLPDMLSVCYGDIERGANCGHCAKCVNTRLGFLALGISDERAFLSRPSLIDSIDQLPIPKKLSAICAMMIRTCETVDALPAGPVKEKLMEYEAAVRERYLSVRRG